MYNLFKQINKTKNTSETSIFYDDWIKSSSTCVGTEEKARCLDSSMSLPSPSECRESLLSTAWTVRIRWMCINRTGSDFMCFLRRPQRVRSSMATPIVGWKELQFGQAELLPAWRRSKEKLALGSRIPGVSRPHFSSTGHRERSRLGDYMFWSKPFAVPLKFQTRQICFFFFLLEVLDCGCCRSLGPAFGLVWSLFRLLLRR